MQHTVSSALVICSFLTVLAMQKLLASCALSVINWITHFSLRKTLASLTSSQTLAAAESKEKIKLSERYDILKAAHNDLLLQVKTTEDALNGLQQQLETLLRDHRAEVQALRSQLSEQKTGQIQSLTETAVLQFLRQLQEKARLLDFAMADIHKLPDVKVGAAARVVQQGVKTVLSDYFDIHSIRNEDEGSIVSIPSDEQARLSLRILRDPSADSEAAAGRLVHRGWRAQTIRLPQSTPQAAEQAQILAPAEIQLS